METILPTSVRGLSGCLGLSGEGRTGPGSVEFGLPAQSVLDIGGFARYGSARMLQDDGWFIVGNQAVGSGAAGPPVGATLTISKTSIPRLQDGDVLWVYGVSMYLVCSAALADYSQALVDVQYNAPSFGTLNNTRQLLWHGSAGSLRQVAALEAWATEIVVSRYWPVPVYQGAEVRTFVQQAAGPGTVTASAQLLCRVHPSGVPPLAL